MLVTRRHVGCPLVICVYPPSAKIERGDIRLPPFFLRFGSHYGYRPWQMSQQERMLHEAFGMGGAAFTIPTNSVMLSLRRTPYALKLHVPCSRGTIISEVNYLRVSHLLARRLPYLPRRHRFDCNTGPGTMFAQYVRTQSALSAPAHGCAAQPDRRPLSFVADCSPPASTKSNRCPSAQTRKT